MAYDKQPGYGPSFGAPTDRPEGRGSDQVEAADP